MCIYLEKPPLLLLFLAQLFGLVGLTYKFIERLFLALTIAAKIAKLIILIIFPII